MIRACRFYLGLTVCVVIVAALIPALFLSVLALALFPRQEDDELEDDGDGGEGEELDVPTLAEGLIATAAMEQAVEDGAWVDEPSPGRLH